MQVDAMMTGETRVLLTEAETDTLIGLIDRVVLERLTADERDFAVDLSDGLENPL